MTALTVSDRFTNKSSRGWRDDEGNRHRHEYVLLCEVVSTDAAGFKWRAVEVLEESGRPTEGAFVAQSGTMAWFGWEAAEGRGDAERVA